MCFDGRKYIIILEMFLFVIAIVYFLINRNCISLVLFHIVIFEEK